MNKPSAVQNKAGKIIGGRRYRDRATPFYSKFGILRLVDFIKFEKAIFAFKYRLKALPAQFFDYFTEVNNVYKRSTRAIINKFFCISFVKTSIL